MLSQFRFGHKSRMAVRYGPGVVTTLLDSVGFRKKYAACAAVSVHQLLLANPLLGCGPFDPFTSPGQGVFVLLIDKCGAVLQLPTQVKLLSLQQATRQRENQNKSTIRTAGWRVDGTQSLMDP